VSGEWHQGFDPGLLWLHLTLPEGADTRAVEMELDAELARVANDGLQQSELERARNLTAASFWKQLATIDGKAHLLGEYEVLHGSWAALFNAPARHAAVTCEELKAVARAILDPRRRTVGELVPAGAG
jgi:zinc protease